MENDDAEQEKPLAKNGVQWKHPTVVGAIVGALGGLVTGLIVLMASPDADKIIEKEQRRTDEIMRLRADSIKAYYFNEMDSLGTDVTYMFSDLKNFEIWNEARDYYVWFNAQYGLASTIHRNNHYQLTKRMKFTFYLVQPTNGNLADSLNFRAKFRGFRSFFQYANDQANKERADVREKVLANIREVYLVKEERRPAMSIFMTRSQRTGRDKAIMYIEDPNLVDPTTRVPTTCIVSQQPMLLELLKTRISELSKPRILNYDSLINVNITDEEILKEK